jgi:PKD repeat protein
VSNATLDGVTLTNSDVSGGTIMNATLTNATVDVNGDLIGGSITTNDASGNPQTYTYSGTPISLDTVMNLPPVAAFSASATSINTGSSVTFTDASTDANIAAMPGPDTAPLNDSVTYSWDFGDGSALDTSMSPTHTFSSAGTFNTVLTVTDTFGTTSTATQSITVTTPYNGGGGGGGGHNNVDNGPKPGTYTLDFTGSSAGIEQGAVTGDVYSFELNGVQHSVRIVEVGYNAVTIDVSSTTQERTLIPGVTAKFDVDGDKVYDLAVSIDKLTYPTATLLLQSISEKVPDTSMVSTAPAATQPAPEPTTTPSTQPAQQPDKEPVKSPEKTTSSNWPSVSPIGAAVALAIILLALGAFVLVRKGMNGGKKNGHSKKR